MCRKLNELLAAKNIGFSLDFNRKKDLTRGMSGAPSGKSIATESLRKCNNDEACIQKLLKDIFGGKS